MVPPFFKVFTLVGNNNQDGDYPEQGPVGAEVEEQPKQKICVDINSIEDVQQQGNWRRVAIPVPADQQQPAPIDDIDFIAPVARPRRPGAQIARPARRHRDIFEINPTCFILHMKNGNSWNVMGSFDEFVEMLTNFRSKMEVVK